MDADRQDPARHLLALAIEIVEGLHQTAVAGQAGNAAAAESAAAAVCLCRRADDLKALSQAILIALEHSEADLPNSSSESTGLAGHRKHAWRTTTALGKPGHSPDPQ